VEVLKDQRPPTAPGHEIARLLAQKLPEASAQHALVLTGVRRCGKSVLQAQLLRTHPGALYVNAEDTRLYGIEPADFPALVEVVAELAGDQAVFLDEIQELPEWPRLVRALLDRGHPLCVTGSNASLLHREMGAKLTGRHRSFEVFPFSYTEYLAFQSAKNSAKTLQGYLDDGGFPGYLCERDPRILQQLLRDIVAAMTPALGPGGPPVTVKIRTGWDEESVNYREAADAAIEGGAKAVTLHARTRAQGYSGKADWSRIADLASRLRVPVFGGAGGEHAGRLAVRRLGGDGSGGPPRPDLLPHVRQGIPGGRGAIARDLEVAGLTDVAAAS